MLQTLGLNSLGELADAALPKSVRLSEELKLDAPLTEAQLLRQLQNLAAKNKIRTSLIGQGYYPTITPSVIRRNVIENPAWYTAYTPYQPEISQGRLEALLVFQTMVADLTGMQLANASLLDEPTAAAEAMALAKRTSKSKSDVFVVDQDTHPQTVSILQTRAEPMGWAVKVLDLQANAVPEDCFGVLVSYPGSGGALANWTATASQAHELGVKFIVATDLLACALLKPPGEFGADIVVGSAQRFGVPMGFGGPHAGFMAVSEDLTRGLPGRLVGVSQDEHGNTAYRLALQTREQHIRREKATSNICTSQVLLAVVAAFYAAYHGAEGLRTIASRVHGLTSVLAAGIEELGLELANDTWFDTLTVNAPGHASQLHTTLAAQGIDVRLPDEDQLGISLNETTVVNDCNRVLEVLAEALGQVAPNSANDTATVSIPSELQRTSEFMTHPWFDKCHSETSMMRWMRKLADADLALDRTMIPLGSCTMKLNAATAMEPITWPEFAEIHPFAPKETTEGYLELIEALEDDLARVTGYDAVSIQPNAGSQGEFAGLLAIREYHLSRGEGHRNICLIPVSAHGTNAASAVMAGMKVVAVQCDDTGGVQLEDLRAKVAEHADDLAAVMVTYPSTYGVYEDTIGEVCRVVHEAGGQVYVDGANLNALLGLSAPGEFGADVSHLNLHKTFCIPHGGGGPGVGPIGVRSHLTPFLPSKTVNQQAPVLGTQTSERGHVGQVSGAPQGSAGILPIPYAYIKMMGAEGLKEATLAAVLAANYIAGKLGDSYPILFTGANNRVAHECILDIREITKQTGVTVDDIAKRLIDYGFHAPTMSFPVAGTLMVEPTESEDLSELDRFCDAMIAIKAEIDAIEGGSVAYEDSMLHYAPHTAHSLLTASDRVYSPSEAAYPPGIGAKHKYWPPVGRIDGAYGDRNLVCSCPPIDQLMHD